MDHDASIPGALDLVANLGWVQRLALSLARNRDAADDLTQEVARVWLERRPERAEEQRGLRAWLATATRNLARDRARSEAARRAREHSVARPEAEDEAYEVVERGAWQKRVTAAVMDLAEPYRSTILYYYLDQLSTRAVAERMSVREATVRKRLERGLALLRAHLDEKTDERRSAHALLPTCAGKGAHSATARGSLAAKISGILLMTTKAKLAGVAIAAGLALFFVLRILPTTDEGERTGSVQMPGSNVLSAVERTGDAAKPEPAVERVAVVESAEREAVAVAPRLATGSLLVHVVWGEDKQPAPGVLLSLYRSGADALFEEPYATSDEDGIVRFGELKPGNVYVQMHRGGQGWNDPIVVVAGKEIQSTVEVAIGVDCKGLVVDAKERPIADAEVLVADWAGSDAYCLTRTAADGTFALRAVHTHCHIGARASGYAASPLREFTAGKGAKVEFRIVLGEAAAELSGVVLDPQRRPVTDAVVQAGNEDRKMLRLIDGTVARAPMPARVRTDAQGRFEFHSLQSGSVPLAVRARGLSPWNQSVELEAGQLKTVAVQLEAGATLIGTVRDSSGAKVPRATIDVGEWGELSHLSAMSDANGNFRLEGVAFGDLKVHAERDGQGAAETKLHARAGETLRWDVVLSNGLLFSGLVLDADGKPVNSAMVEAHLERGSRDVQWFAYENTDAAGRFHFKNCVAGEPVRISVHRKSSFPEAVLQHVVPSSEELVIRLPKETWVYIQGRVLDPEDKAVPNVHVSPFFKGGNGSPAETADPSTGAFRYGPYPPGEYQLHVQADGYPAIHLPWHVIGPDEVWDVGTLKFQRGGSLLVNLLGAESAPHHLELWILDASDANVSQISVQDGIGRAGPFVPGSYAVQIAGENIACKVQPFEIRAGVEMRVDVQIKKGVTVEIECPLPEDAARESGVEVVISDASGKVVMRGTAWAEEGTPKMSVCLAPGDYRIATSKDALRGSGSITVVAGAEPAKVSVRSMPQ